MDMKRPTFSFKKLIPLKSWNDTALLFSMWLDNSRIKGITQESLRFSFINFLHHFLFQGSQHWGALWAPRDCPLLIFSGGTLVKKADWHYFSNLTGLLFALALGLLGDFNALPKIILFQSIDTTLFSDIFLYVSKWLHFNFSLFNVVFMKSLISWK